ncbi:oligosaccharyl transferase, archaeosortase A system-associated [Methanoculleus sp. Wushi-C6]|uniref:dolichyl-phosphooligosaccharide-protein glycotransferase n=1 Tax=Methanoculleus caldifontis TaxID=2651577 RepID=A0ABU3WYE4_9EURY|nr:oligosaccharyl transferase, archaeosortase A system-associated [Methanoculleus sp. Wushi-C6]MDV2480806.1 oligosaccharyl transferase, archaeosortase A system-associated [Methanoculleus sp. Wushi-C6]
MAHVDLEKYRPYLIIGFIVLFTVLAFWTRGLPAEGLVTADGVNLLGNDPWYNLRQVEQTVANFPGYAWFDPMTLYPSGDVVYWGPLFIQIMAALCVIVGATTRPEIMVVASWVPPLMAAAMVPVTYLLARKIADWKTGILAAGLIAVVSGNYAYRSLFGFVDHHIAETLFSTIFALAYVVALLATRDRPFSLADRSSLTVENLKAPVLASALAGVGYLLGFFNMPTMILFALIVAGFTLVQFFIDFFQDQRSDYLVLVNAVTFGVVILGTVAFGFPHPGIDLSRYTVGHVIASAALIAGTLALYGLATYLRGRPKYYFPAALAGVGLAAVVVLFVALPEIYALLVSSLFAFFGEQPITTTVQEARAWSFDSAWMTFHWGLLLAAGGIAALLWWSREKANPAHIFVVVWSLVILASTMAHVRYEYYLAANIALLAAVFAGAVLNVTWKEVTRLFGSVSSAAASNPGTTEKQEEPAKKGKKGGKAPEAKKPKASAKGQPDYLKVGAFAAVVAMTLLFAVSSLQANIALGSNSRYGGIDSQWTEALEWMGANTPDPGVDYLAILDQKTFTYPETSYGVMSWWDYGHWITFLSKRIPNNNPFQHGVAGPNGSAVYFVSTDEAAANRVLDNIGTRYIVTDIQLATGKFHAPATWADPAVGNTRFEPRFFVPASAGSTSHQVIPFYNREFYLTMISRLHNFDGSMTDPTVPVIYAEYRDASTANTSLPVITRTEQVNATEGAAAVEAYNRNAPPGSHAVLLNLYYQYRGDSILQPVERVPALQHYRLVHETPQNIYGNVGANGPDLKAVKIFEYVPGAVIKGDGIIEVPVTTNTGRTFTYRQESVNGTFVVPYATDGAGEVKTTGSYRIAGTGQTFDVSEEDILQGRTIN